MNKRPSKTGVRFFDWLFDTSGYPLLYVLKLWPIDVIGSLAIMSVSLCAIILLGRADLLEVPPQLVSKSRLYEFFMGVIIAPAVETLLMIPIFGLLKRFTLNRVVLILLSAAIWAGFHSLAWLVWGLGVFWGFVILSSAFLAWREKSAGLAYSVTFGIHALHNLTILSAGLIATA